MKKILPKIALPLSAIALAVFIVVAISFAEYHDSGTAFALAHSQPKDIVQTKNGEIFKIVKVDPELSLVVVTDAKGQQRSFFVKRLAVEARDVFFKGDYLYPVMLREFHRQGEERTQP